MHPAIQDGKYAENSMPERQMSTTTSAVLRLECSIDCISGSVGHQQHIFRLFYHCPRFL